MIGNAALEHPIDDAGRLDRRAARSMGSARRKTSCRAAEPSCDRGSDDEDRKRDGEEENGGEGKRGDGDLGPALQRPLAHPQHGFDDDREHRCLQAEEQRLDGADLSKCSIDPAQDAERNKARKDE